MRVARVLGIGFGAIAILGVIVWARYGRWVRVPEPQLTAKLGVGSLEWGGRTRHYLAYVPARVTGAPALVVALHGSMGDGALTRTMFAYEFDRLADAHGFVVVYPDGVERHWNDCRKVAPYAANTLGIDDVGFLRALVEELVASHGVDRSRVFATGISNGGQMAFRLALEAPDLVRAVAPVVASLPTEDNMACVPRGEPVSILLMNGTEDPMSPYGGGEVALFGVWGSRGTVLSTPDSAAYFARLAGYAGKPRHEELPDRTPGDGSTVAVDRWSEPGRKAVVLCSVRGGGHTVPHPVARLPRLLGRTNADISAAEEIWSFFAAAP